MINKYYSKLVGICVIYKKKKVGLIKEGWHFKDWCWIVV